MQDIRSPLCFWSLLTIFIVKPLNCAKLRFGKISRHLRVHIISYHGHNLCDALSARPNSTSPAFPSPLRSEDFASSWFRKSSRLPRLPPFVFKTCFNFQSEYKWQMEGIPDNYAKYEWDSDRRHCNQKITQSGARWYAKSPNAAESLKDLELLHDSNQVKISDQLFSVSWYHKSKPKGLNQLLKIMWTWQL